MKPSILLTAISNNNDGTKNDGYYNIYLFNILPFFVPNSRQFHWTGIYKLRQLCPSNDVRSTIINVLFSKQIHILYCIYSKFYNFKTRV